MVLDSQGRAALIALADLPPGFLRIFYGVKILDSGEVPRTPAANMSFPFSAPRAQPLYARTKFGISFVGRENALVWNIGWIADNGFSVPTRRAIETAYEVVEVSTNTHLSV